MDVLGTLGACVQHQWDRSDVRNANCGKTAKLFPPRAQNATNCWEHSICWENKTSCRVPLPEIAPNFLFGFLPFFRWIQEAFHLGKQKKLNGSSAQFRIWAAVTFPGNLEIYCPPIKLSGNFRRYQYVCHLVCFWNLSKKFAEVLTWRGESFSGVPGRHIHV